MDCIASISVSKSDCVQFRLYLFLSAHTHHKNIFYKFIEKVCERENFDYVRFVFIFYTIFIWMYRKKKKKRKTKKEKNGRIERTIRIHDVHFYGTSVEILVFSWRQKMNFTMWSWSVDTKQSAVWFLAYRICWLSTENNSIPAGWTLTTRILSIWNTCFSHTFETRIKPSRLLNRLMKSLL